jgi:hypothetical protein
MAGPNKVCSGRQVGSALFLAYFTNREFLGIGFCLLCRWLIDTVFVYWTVVKRQNSGVGEPRN